MEHHHQPSPWSSSSFSSFFSSNPKPRKPRNSDDTFHPFFGSAAASTPPPSSPYIPNPRKYDVSDFDFDFGFGFGFGFGFPNRYESSLARNPPDVETVLPCSLEDLYNGRKKKIKITRTVVDFSNQLQTISEILTIEIKPGFKKGTKITFLEKGNQELGSKIADRIFTIDEKPHKVFTRDGNDLIINQKISLLEALVGKTIELTTLDGRNLVVTLTEIVKPGYELIVPNEGMPILEEPTKKGNLVIKFEVEYPTVLTTKRKYYLEKALPGNP